MLPATKPQIINLYFKTPQNQTISSSDLITFSSLYEEEIRKIIKHLKSNEGKYISLFFTRILPNGKMQEKREFLGIPKNVSEKGFEFFSAWDISAEYLTDEEVKNQVVFNNPLGILPTLGIIPLEEILTTKHTKVAEKYFVFWEKAKKELEKFLNKDNHVEIYLSNKMVIEGNILEINKSNLLIYSKKERKNQLQGGYYVYTNIIPHQRFLYFISSDYFIEKIKITPWKININPCDED